MINQKDLDLVNARQGFTGSYVEMKQTLMTYLLHNMYVVHPPRYTPPQYLHIPNIDALSLSLDISVISEPTNLYLTTEEEVRWCNEM